MLRSRITKVLAAVAIALPLAACDFSATGNVECHTDEVGKYVCVGSSTATPSTVAPPPTVEPTTNPPVNPTTPPPVTTEPPPTTTNPPPTTTNPPPATATTAAAKFGWGTPVANASDEFNYTGAPDPAKWYNPGSGSSCWPGHNGNGKRCGDKSVVDGSKLVMSGDTAGNTGLIGQMNARQYGRWEARVRSEALGADNGRTYHPVLIVWPANDVWPQNGEYDFLENDKPGEACAKAWMHYPHQPGPVQQEGATETNCGAPLSEWHNVAFEWTPNHVKGFIDGNEWFSFSGGANSTRQAIQNMSSGKMTIQLDNFNGSNMQPAKIEVDWVRTYAL